MECSLVIFRAFQSQLRLSGVNLSSTGFSTVNRFRIEGSQTDLDANSGIISSTIHDNYSLDCYIITHEILRTTMSDIGSKESTNNKNLTKLSAHDHSPTRNNVENSLKSSMNFDSKSESTAIGKVMIDNETEVSIEKPPCLEALRMDVGKSAESQLSLNKDDTNDMSKDDLKPVPIGENALYKVSDVESDSKVEGVGNQASSTTPVVDRKHGSTSKASLSSQIHNDIDQKMDDKLPENPLLCNRKGDSSVKLDENIDLSDTTKNEVEPSKIVPDTKQTPLVSSATEASASSGIVPSTGRTNHISSETTNSDQRIISDKEQATTSNDTSKSTDARPDTTSNNELRLDTPHSAAKVTNRELSEKYAPYILPGDHTLEDARERLKTAIEQTRELRVAFTKNLYDKYRIVLRPVPKSVEAIVGAIRAQPRVIQEKILQEMQMISTEKEIEKRAAQKLNSEFANASTSSDISAWLGGLQGVDNAEQLSWYGVGLYIVVLPEEDVNEADLADSGITERGPIDPATGHRSKDLAQSAALASSSMLERVRKAAELRRQRIQNQDYTSMVDFSSDPGIVPFPSTFTTSRSLKKSPGIVIKSPPPGAKAPKNKPSSSLASLLNLSANAEGLRLNGKLSAAGFALNTRNLKSSSIVSRLQNRHPFPQSKGARSATYGQTSGQFSSHPLSLPSLTTATERKNKVSSHMEIDSVSETTLSAFKSAVNPVMSYSANDKSSEINPIQNKNVDSKCIGIKRKFNEIRIMEELRNQTQPENITPAEEVTPKGADSTDPCLVLAVMKSLGLLVSCRKSKMMNGSNGNVFGLQEIFGKEKSDELDSLKLIEGTILEHAMKKKKVFSVAPELSRPNEVEDTKIQSLRCYNATAEEPAVLHSTENADPTQLHHLGHATTTDESTALKLTEKNEQTSTLHLNNQYVPSLRGGGEESKIDAHNSSNSKSKSSVAEKEPKQKIQSLDSSSQRMHPLNSSFTMMTAYQNGNTMGPISANMNHMQGQHNVDSFGIIPDHCGRSSQSQSNVPTNQIQQLQAAAMQQNEIVRPSNTGVPSEFFNGMHQMQIQSFINHHGAEWASLASQPGVLSGPHAGPAFDPLSMGLSPHQAAMLVRDRAAQALFAREQQLHAQVAAAQHNASAFVMSQAVMMNSINVPQYGYIPPNSDSNMNMMVQGKQLNQSSESHKEVPNFTLLANSTQTNDSGKTTKSSSSVKHMIGEEKGKSTKSKHANNSVLSGDLSVPSKSEKTNRNGLVSNVARQSNATEPKLNPTQNHSNATSVNDIENSISKRARMSFVIPPHSSDLNKSDADKILSGLFHEISKPPIENKGVEVSKKDDFINHRIQYLLKVSAAIPISKTFVLGLLKENLAVPRLNTATATFSQKNGLASPMDIIVAIIVTWVWSNYRSLFENVFELNGRVDADPHCKWVVKAAIESVTDEAVSKELHKLSWPPSSSEAIQDPSEPAGDNLYALAILMSRALNRSLSLNSELNAVLPNYDVLVDHLDRLREKALRCRSQERVLMANLMAKRIRMSEAFSNAYTSSMIRAGNALGYDELGEIVQDEETTSFSMLPFDILSDSIEAWEDPCRPLCGYSSNLDSDELSKKAHAKAMIQRSLKKLQDRHNIQGGTQTAGPYSDVPDEQSAYEVAASPPPRPSPRSGVKRKLSSMSLGGESSIRGLDAAVSSVFNPGHFSAPFLWDKNSIGCSPYGRHDQNLIFPSPLNVMDTKREVNILQSSEAIDWKSIAAMFEDVVHVEKPSSKVQDDHHNVAVPLGSNIIAPFCRKCDGAMASSDVDSDDEDENLDDDQILAAHTGVLDSIKEKFDTMMRIRQEYLDRSRRHSFGRT